MKNSREVLGLEPVSLMIKKSRLILFGQVECDNDWVKCCITWETEGINREDAQNKHDGIVLRITWQV